LVRLPSTLSPVASDPSWFPVPVTWAVPGASAALTLLIEPDDEAEPVEMLAAQQTEIRPMAAVAAATR
jgi:hypothetical protein